MKEPISIKELVAIILKRGKLIICMALIGAILAGGAKGYKELQTARLPQYSEEVIEQNYIQEMNEYEEQKKVLIEELGYLEAHLEYIEAYSKTSILLQIPSWQTPTNVITFTIEKDSSSQEESELSDYQVAQITEIYLQKWKSISYVMELENNPYAGLGGEAYIRELTQFADRGNGIFEITAYGLTAEDAQALSESIFAWLQRQKNEVTIATSPHELEVISRTSKFTNNEVATEVSNMLEADRLDTIESITNCKEQLKELLEPQRTSGYSLSAIFINTIAFAIIGAIVAVVLACAFIWLKYIICDGVESSRQVAAVLGVPFLADTAGKKGFFVRLANMLIGERYWEDSAVAAQFAHECVAKQLPANAEVVLASTLALDENEIGVASFVAALREAGHTVTFVTKAETNPLAVRAIRESDCVIMAERAGKSGRQPMLNLRDVIEQTGAELIGFVLV